MSANSSSSNLSSSKSRHGTLTFPSSIRVHLCVNVALLVLVLCSVFRQTHVGRWSVWHALEALQYPTTYNLVLVCSSHCYTNSSQELPICVFGGAFMCLLLPEQSKCSLLSICVCYIVLTSLLHSSRSSCRHYVVHPHIPYSITPPSKQCVHSSPLPILPCCISPVQPGRY